MHRRSNQPQVYAFIDSQNLNLGIQRMGWKMDWRKFRSYLETTHHVTKAYMFIGYMAENIPLYEHMHELGFLVVLKPTIDMMTVHPPEEAEGSGETAPHTNGNNDDKPPVKGNVDADLVLYAMKEMTHYHQAIIVSGDGDFHGLIEYLIAQKKLANVLTPNWQYSSLLKEFEPYIIRLDQLRGQLQYYDHKRSSKKQSEAS